MSNSNYIQETEVVQQNIKNNINIEDYILNYSRDIRISHIDLNTPCIPYYLTMNTKTGKKGDIATNAMAAKVGPEILKEYLSLTGKTSRQIHYCHLCDRGSKTKDFICISTLHTYFGTITENYYDKSDITRQLQQYKRSVAGDKKVSELQNSGMYQKKICQWCGKEADLCNLERWHNDNCKFNPLSYRYQKYFNPQ